MSKAFYYGGQAVIEGVMMRGKEDMAVAVRRPDGKIDVICRTLPRIYTGRWRKLPIFRGVIILIETVELGVQALFHSAQVAATLPDQEESEISPGMLWGTMAAGLAFSVVLFFLIPLFLTRFIIDPYVTSAVLSNVIEGVIRIGIFIAYLKMMNMIPDIRRVFSYHGAEHKTVNAFEAGAPMEVAAVRPYSTAHIRCGTGFLLIVLLISIVVFAMVGRPGLVWSIVSRVVLIPVIASIGYEIVRLSADHSSNPIVRVLLLPGLALQSLTTREPTDEQLETAICALKKVIESGAEQSEAALGNTPVPADSSGS
jgi:uncharacterized protein YqhQ